MNRGKVYLVGAGPGDSGLLTVKGLWCIRHADVIIYDYLASAALLNEANENAELIYAGKQAGHHHMRQKEIQELLLEKAFEGKIVVRLKGGDPFIFGRGGEEALALKGADIPFEIVPGVSSAYSVPAYAGIPVTHRGVASQVHFVTGHEKSGGDGPDYHVLAKAEGSLVFLMGMSHMREISRALIACGKNKDTPAAVITDGTTGIQKEAAATLETIADEGEKAGLTPPGILVVGPVVKLAQRLDWRKKKTLSGKKILLTGTKELVKKQHESLLKTGAEPIDMSLIYTEPAKTPMLAEHLENIEAFQWIVFTSSRGTALFFETLRQRHIDYRRLAGVKFAAVGPGTADGLKAYGFLADEMPGEYRVEALAGQLLKRLLPGERVLVFRAEEGSRSLNECFDSRKIDYIDLHAYTTRTDWRKRGLLVRSLSTVDIITFASPSAVKAFKEMAEIPEDCPDVLCIGPVTGKAAEEAGFKVRAVAEEYTAEGMTECLCRITAGRN